MPDCVDAPVEAVEVAAIPEPSDLLPRKTQLKKLPGGNHAMLPCCQCGQPPVTWTILLVPTPNSIVHVRHRPHADTKPVTRG
jgi:hypothetical protein